MSNARQPTPPHDPSDCEHIYTFGYGDIATQMMASRTAEVHARFFLPHIHPDMHVLDLGCGPGSITLGLAKTVAPGEAVGVDIEAAQLDLARAQAVEHGVTNVRFEVGDVCGLSFPDSMFDAAFGHTILMQFQDPTPVLAEVHRVLKPGGVVGFREPMFSGNLCEPPESAQHRFWKLFGRVVAHNGGDTDVGRRLGTLLDATGFGRLIMSASYHCAETPEAKRATCERTARYCTEAAFMEQALRLGWVGLDARETISTALQAEGNNPVAFYASAWREVVGWKEDLTTPTGT